MDWKKYILTFAITAAIFGTAFYFASRFNAQRLQDIRTTQEQISNDILSSEVEYELLGQLNCQDITQNTVLSDELNSIASRLSYAESTLGADNEQVISLKEQYSLLEIKDYLLMQKLSLQCHIHPVFILYFYSNAGDCPDCSREGDVLTYLRQTYPGLRIYSFDYNLKLSAIDALVVVRKVENSLPALVINNRAPVYGLKRVEDILKIAPEIARLSTTTAVSSSTQI